MPVRPLLFCWPKTLEDYETALQRAKASSVPIQDQEKALDLMWRNDPNMHNPISFGDWKHAILKPDSIYGPFSVGYEIRDEVQILPKEQFLAPENQNRDKPILGFKTEVAILYDDTPEKEESQEYSLQKENDAAKEWELWRDFLHEVGCKRYLLDGEDFMSTRWEELMDLLKEKFTITRK